MEKTDLQIAVEAELGVELCPVFFADAEQYARRKLEVANRSAGREWGEDGYGDEYQKGGGPVNETYRVMFVRKGQRRHGDSGERAWRTA